MSGGGSKTTTTSKTKTKASTPTTDTAKKLSSKSGGHATKTAPNRPISTNAIIPKVTTNLQQSSINLDPLLESKKLKRSNSFFLTRKLSKIYQTLTGSKDNLNKIPENDDHHAQRCAPIPNPFTFTRSASLATIPLRRSYRNSNIRESKLEQLREEEGHGHTIVASASSPTDIEPMIRNELFNIPPAKIVPNGNELSDNERISMLSFPSDRKNSFSLMSSLRRTFSVTPAKRKTHNPKWSASLMNLQQIDVMISYENLSFINYDKFNTYEANLIRHMSQTDVNAKLLSNRNSVPDEKTIFSSDARKTVPAESSKLNEHTHEQSTADQYFTNYPEVKRRNKKKRVNVNAECDRVSIARRSCIENGKSQQSNRNTFRWSTPCESLNAKQFNKSNVSLKTTVDIEQSFDDSDVTTFTSIPATVAKESSFERCISCNSLRRTQSMNDIDSDDIRSDPRRCRSFVSNLF